MAELALARPLASGDISSLQFMHDDLARSGLTPEDIRAYPVAPIAMGQCPGYCIPYADPRMYRVRYKRDEDKYIQPKGITSIWWSPNQNKDTFRSAPTLYIIEGEKKAAKFVKTFPHIPTLGIGGCWMFVKKNDAGMRMLMPEIISCIQPGMNIVAIFDGDIMSKPNIQHAAYTLNQLLIQQGCELKLFKTPIGKGVDDWLVECPHATLHDLKEIQIQHLEIGRKAVYDSLDLYLTDKGTPIPSEENIKRLLQFYFEDTIVDDKRRGVRQNGEYVGFKNLLSNACSYIQKEHIANAPLSRIANALEFFLLDTKRDLVKEGFEKLEWDEVERLNSWGAEYFESDTPEMKEYLAEWGRLLMTAYALRVVNPGCQVDFIPILVGPQGIGKTSFFRDLATFDGWQYYYSCSNLSPDMGDQNRTQCLAFSKNTIIDLGEGAAFNPKKVDQENFKQFITQTVDEFRIAYDKSTTINPRSFIFVGTSNRHDQITDRSGSRRFLPIHVDRVKRLPYEEKLQILAEVIAKRHEILDTKWYDVHVDFNKMPRSLKESMPYVTDPQTLVNSQFTRTDDFAEFVDNMLSAGEAATFKSTGQMFISGNYVSGRYPRLSEGRFATQRLGELAISDIFPWKLEEHRPRVSQLHIPEVYLAYYTSGVSTKDPMQQMLKGYKVKRKS